MWIDARTQGYGHGAEGGGGGWCGLRQVALLRTTRTLVGQAPGLPVVEDHFYLTNIAAAHPDGSPQSLLAIARNHWEIENGLHWVKDKTMGEDQCREKKAACALAWLRNIAVFLLGFAKGDSGPQKQILIQARPAIAQRLVSIKKRPRKPIGDF